MKLQCGISHCSGAEYGSGRWLTEFWDGVLGKWCWLELLQSCRSQRRVPCDCTWISWSFSSLPGLRASIFNEESPLKGLMKSWTHSVYLFEILPPSFGICFFPKSRSKVPNVPPYLCVWDQGSKYLRGFVFCVAQQSWPTAPLRMAIHTENQVFSYRMAVLALPAETPSKVLLFAFSCQPDHPSLSQTADISSPASMSFVHQSSSQCCFMMCCKTTMLPWVCSAWLPHLSLLSLHTGPSSITASSELRVRTWSAVLPEPGVVWTLISRSLCPRAFFFFPGNVTSSYI